MSYVNVTGNIRVALTATIDASTTVNGITDGKTYSLPQLPQLNFSKGTGNGQFNLLTPLVLGSLASTTLLVDLTTGADEWATAINMARAKVLLVLNFETTASHILKVGGATTNPWLAPFADVTDKLVVQPGYLASDGTTIVPGFILLSAPAAAGMATSGTSKVLQLDSGSNTVAYGYAILGADA